MQTHIRIDTNLCSQQPAIDRIPGIDDCKPSPTYTYMWTRKETCFLCIGLDMRVFIFEHEVVVEKERLEESCKRTEVRPLLFRMTVDVDALKRLDDFFLLPSFMNGKRWMWTA